MSISRFGHSKLFVDPDKKEYNLNFPFIELYQPSSPYILNLPADQEPNSISLHTVTLNKGFEVRPSKTGTITAISDIGNGRLRVNSSSHGLSKYELVSFFGTTNYNKSYMVESVFDNDNFDITETFVSSQSGTWERGDIIVPKMDGDYMVCYNGSFSVLDGNNRLVFIIMSKNGVNDVDTTFVKQVIDTHTVLSYSFMMTLKAGDLLQQSIYTQFNFASTLKINNHLWGVFIV